MPVTIAITGKGGVGKSTIAALLVRHLVRLGKGSILAVDADSNVNLNDLLGVPVGEAVGAIREEMRDKVNNIPGGMSKQQFLEYKIHTGLTETAQFDLIAMGRPEGPGCYCYANSLLRDILKTLAENYQYVLIDNEAGMEHLSRRTVQKIDFLIILSDPSVRGVKTAGRISRLLKELETRVGQKFLVVNRARVKLSDQVLAQIKEEGLDLLAVILQDDDVSRNDESGQSVFDLPETAGMIQQVEKIWIKLESFGK
ncbi:AAA family ATPase [candidate division KSB1 bacterium]|nr:AAA family ATPase [candidate division KSB1 bacterium]